MLRTKNPGLEKHADRRLFYYCRLELTPNLARLRGRDIVNGALDENSHDFGEHTSQDQNANQTKVKDSLEMRSMNQICKNIAVTIPWLQGTDSSREAPAWTKRTKWSWRHRKQQKDTSDILLADLEEDAETYPENRGNNAASRDAVPPEGNRAPEVTETSSFLTRRELTEVCDHIKTLDHRIFHP